MGAREVIRIPADWFICVWCDEEFDTRTKCIDMRHEWKWAGVKRG